MSDKQFERIVMFILETGCKTEYQVYEDSSEFGNFNISVHVWIINTEGEFLIQKRSANKKKFPNMWSMMGGAVLSGETSEEACIRETDEELGIMLESCKK